MCKAIGALIQNCLLYLPAKYQGRATAWTRIISNFQWLLKMENLFLYSLRVTFLSAQGILTSSFDRLMKPISKTMCLRSTSLLGFFCTLFIVITMRRTFVQTGFVQQLLFRYRIQAIFCEFPKFRKCLVLLRCITHCRNYILYSEETQTKNVLCRFIGL